MATSQSGKRKLIPHAQKDGSSAWKEREREEEEIQRDEGSRIEPDEVKETPPPPLSFSPSLRSLFHAPPLDQPTIYNHVEGDDRKCFPGGEGGGIASIEKLSLERLFRPRLIGYGDAV